MTILDPWAYVRARLEDAGWKPDPTVAGEALIGPRRAMSVGRAMVESLPTRGEMRGVLRRHIDTRESQMDIILPVFPSAGDVMAELRLVFSVLDELGE